MKISEMTSEQAVECLIRLSVPLGHICDDDGITNIAKKYAEIKGDTENIRAFGRLLPEITTYALKTHKKDLFEVVGALIDKSNEEVAKMSFIELLKAIKGSYDEVLRDFFISNIKPGKDTVG